MSRSENSTNVRTSGLSSDVFGWAVRGAGTLAPGLVAQAAERLFVRPPPRQRESPRARALLTAGDAFSVPFGDGRLAGWKWGTGPTVLLVHGWGGRSSQLGAFVTALVRAGYSALAFDAPAHGA